jgi:Restriction endonuclease
VGIGPIAMNKKASADFEHLIERIHLLVESGESKVTWNDRIIDPDNPEQLRQIDVTIARQDRLTHVECRIHSAPQDVKWIEELIGRRASLKADAMIAVSASGFTKGAIKKAEAHGIILRTLHTLSEQEIRDWGRVTDVDVIYYEFTDTVITFRIPPDARIRGPFISDEHGKPVPFRGLFESIMNRMADDASLKDVDQSAVVKVHSPVDAPVLVDGIKSTYCIVDTNVRRIVRKLSLASVVAYAAPDGVDLTENANVQRFDADGFEILQNSDEVAVVVDLTDVPLPPRCLLHTVLFDFGRIIEMRWFKPVGLHEAMNYSTDVTIRVEWN